MLKIIKILKIYYSFKSKANDFLMNKIIDYEETPIKFSQTWADPNVEIKILRKFKNKELNLCFCGKDIDTICCILNMINNIKIIDIIDLDPHQIKLIELKIALIKFLNGFEIKKLIEGDWLKINDLLKQLLEQQLIKLNTYDYWLDHITLLNYGLNNCGTYKMI